MGLKFGRSMVADVETAPDKIVYHDASQADGHRPANKSRDPDHHALYWLFGRRSKVIPIESPKPLGKRARRRLRGRIKQEKRNGKA